MTYSMRDCHEGETINIDVPEVNTLTYMPLFLALTLKMTSWESSTGSLHLHIYSSVITGYGNVFMNSTEHQHSTYCTHVKQYSIPLVCANYHCENKKRNFTEHLRLMSVWKCSWKATFMHVQSLNFLMHIKTPNSSTRHCFRVYIIYVQFNILYIIITFLNYI